MDFYARLKPFVLKQSCILCTELSASCICLECQSTFTNKTRRCRSCAHPLPQSVAKSLDFCGQCLTHSRHFDYAHTLYDYQGAIAQLIKRFKYNQQLCIGYYFAQQLFDFYQSISNNKRFYDAIIPMPLNGKRTQQRGYNQVLELLRIFAQKTDIIIDTHSVQRIKATRSLSSLKLEQRQKEIKGVFGAKPVSYRRVLLVDDVMTTGSSLNELAKTLIKVGVGHCDVLTLARAELSV